MTQVRTFNQTEVRYCPHTSITDEVWQPIKKGTTTSEGAAGGTTIIDTNGDSGGADTYNGLYWVEILSGTCMGQLARVVDDDGAGTLTLEDTGFSATIASGVSYQIWKSPDPVVVVDSSSGETTMVDAVRAEPVDSVSSAPFWSGYYALPITGTHRGKKALITNHVPGTGTFTLGAAFGSALAAGDVVLLRKFIEVDKVSTPDGPAFHGRPGMRANFGVAKGKAGASGGQLSFETQITASGSLAAATSPANASVLSGLFQGAGLAETVATSEAVEAGSNTTAIKITTGTREKFVVGQMVIWNGNARRITSLEDGAGAADTVNVSPAFPGTPAAADVLYATRMYAKTTTGDLYGVLVEVEIDGVRHTYTGCKGSVDLIAGPALSWKFSVDDQVVEYKVAPWNAGSAYTTVAIILDHERLCWIDAVAADMGGITASPNTAVTAKTVSGAYGRNGRTGYQIVDASKASVTFRELSTTTGELTQLWRYLAQTDVALAVVWGSHANMLALTVPVAGLMTYPKATNESGLMAFPEVMAARDAGTALNGTTVQKMPDWALHLS